LEIDDPKNRKHCKQRPAYHRDEQFFFFQPTVNQSAALSNKNNLRIFSK
jgi:hypothetical protein